MKATKKKANGGEYVLLRATGAGLHVGRLVSADLTAGTVVLADARRLWRWRCLRGATLHEVALYGCDETWTRLSEPLDRITVLGVHEILPLAAAARANLTRSRWGT